jgi:hypothetical protein
VKPQRLSKALAVLVAAVLAAAFMASFAQAETPASGYSQFAGCPSPKTENAEVRSCLRTVFTGGSLKLGKKEVPITKAIELAGGTNEFGENFSFNSKGGLSLVKQKVPGGILGLTGKAAALEELGGEALQLYAQVELAGTPAFVSLEHIRLPIKVRLINPLLGSSCRIGSETSPISLNLRTGETSPPAPNMPITGMEPAYSEDPTTEILHANNGTLVDNSFAAPVASGCTLTLGSLHISLDKLVNEAWGLPAAAGSNTAVLNYNLETARSERVYP